MIVLDVVDDTPFLRAALTAYAETRPDWEIGTAARGWVDFIFDWNVSSDCVVVRAELRDHVPAVLKVRALTRLGIATVVIEDTPHPAYVHRLSEAGAAAVLSRAVGLEQLVRRCAMAATSRVQVQPPRAGSVVLTDRELQIAALFCSREAPTGSALARLLRLSEETVRVYLRNVRRKYRALGWEGHSRQQLRQRLIEDGWLHPDV